VLDRDARITLLLTDVQMPNMDGYDLARRATSLRPGLSIVFMSGADPGREGFPFVRKPFSLKQLEAVVGPACH
jgi:CheY-like chemotaxis protein